MNGETFGIISGIVSLCISIGVVVFNAGKLKEKIATESRRNDDHDEQIKALVTKESLAVLEGRCREEWARNSDQHKEFYATSDSVIAIKADFVNVDRRLTNIENNTMEILKRLAAGA